MLGTRDGRLGDDRPRAADDEGDAGRSGGAALALVVLGALATGLLVALGPAAVRAALAPGADASALLAGAAALLAAMVALRLAVTAAAVVVGRLPGELGRAGRTVALRVSPRVLRSVVRLAVSGAVATAAVTGPTAAFADPPAAGAGQTATGQAYPVLDRVAEIPQPGQRRPVPEAAPPVDAAPRPAPRAEPAARPPDPPQPAVVVVRPGDSLWAIAARHLPPGHSEADVARAWPRWYAANRALIGPDPRSIRPGQRLEVPQ